MKDKKYLAPSIEMVCVRIEKGFAASGAVENDYASEGAAGMLQEGNTYDF